MRRRQCDHALAAAVPVHAGQHQPRPAVLPGPGRGPRHPARTSLARAGRDDDAIGVVVVERLTDLQRQILEARIPVRGWLSPAHYAAAIHIAFDPDSLPLYDLHATDEHALDPRAAGPSATERHWRWYQHDSGMSSTVWVHELPRRPVHANWLAPLLQQTDVRRTVSLVVEPLSPARAERSINNQRLAAAGSIYMKQRHGLVVDARTQKEL